jgi:hypothetical protein
VATPQGTPPPPGATGPPLEDPLDEPPDEPPETPPEDDPDVPPDLPPLDDPPLEEARPEEPPPEELLDDPEPPELDAVAVGAPPGVHVPRSDEGLGATPQAMTTATGATPAIRTQARFMGPPECAAGLFTKRAARERARFSLPVRRAV